MSDISDILNDVAAKIKKQATEPDINGYKPHAKQEAFHKSDAHAKLYIGGNRGGKTVAGITEGIWRAKGQHPYTKVPEAPTRGRIISTDRMHGLQQVILPKLSQWLPPSMLNRGSWEDTYSASSQSLTFANGSTIDLMTYEQDTEKFSGASKHWTHFDEEPPLSIYQESCARLIDTNGFHWITMTPVEGMSWVYDSLYVPGLQNEDPDIFVVQVDMAENPYLSKEARDRYLKTLDPETRAAREKGTFVQLGGLVFKSFDRNQHVISPISNFSNFGRWEHYISMDSGFNNPTAFLFHLFDRYNLRVITFAEHYEREMVVKDHAAIVKGMQKEYGYEDAIIIGDPAIAQRSIVTGTSVQAEYAISGINIILGNNSVATGVNQVNTYLKDKYNGVPRWQITENCTNLLSEIPRLHWKRYSSAKMRVDRNLQEEINKVNDHACDAARYFFSAIPSIKLEEQDERVTTRLATLSAVTKRARSGYERFDPNLTTNFQNSVKRTPSFQEASIQSMEWD